MNRVRNMCRRFENGYDKATRIGHVILLNPKIHSFQYQLMIKKKCCNTIKKGNYFQKDQKRNTILMSIVLASYDR